MQLSKSPEAHLYYLASGAKQVRHNASISRKNNKKGRPFSVAAPFLKPVGLFQDG
jgi:hypothetical protein